jgi:hypothetical protein
VLEQSGPGGACGVRSRADVDVVVELQVGEVEVSHEPVHHLVKVGAGCRVPEIKLIAAPFLDSLAPTREKCLGRKQVRHPAAGSHHFRFQP